MVNVRTRLADGFPSKNIIHSQYFLALHTYIHTLLQNTQVNKVVHCANNARSGYTRICSTGELN